MTSIVSLGIFLLVLALGVGSEPPSGARANILRFSVRTGFHTGIIVEVLFSFGQGFSHAAALY